MKLSNYSIQELKLIADEIYLRGCSMDVGSKEEQACVNAVRIIEEYIKQRVDNIIFDLNHKST